MTGTSVAPQRRELLVTRQELLALGAVARGESTGAEAVPLTARGLLTPGGRVADAVAATADAVGSPLATVRVTAVGPEGARAAQLWVGAGRAVLHAGSDAPAPVVSVGRSLLPQLLVRATGLGPRPVGSGPAFAADGATVAAACRGRAATPWSGTVERPTLRRLSWQLRDGDAGDLAFLDLGPLGFWRPASGQGAELTWAPTSGSSVWRALGGLFAAAVADRPGA